jgi:hypothetical protein
MPALVAGIFAEFQRVDGRDIRAFTPVFDGLLPGHDSGRKWFNVTGISSKGRFSDRPLELFSREFGGLTSFARSACRSTLKPCLPVTLCCRFVWVRRTFG